MSPEDTPSDVTKGQEQRSMETSAKPSGTDPIKITSTSGTPEASPSTPGAILSGPTSPTQEGAGSGKRRPRHGWTPARLDYICLYCPELGRPRPGENGEEEATELRQILYFHPSTLPSNEQLKHIGLAQGLTAFAGAFKSTPNPSQPGTGFDVVRTGRYRLYQYSPESGVYLLMRVSLGYTTRPSRTDRTQTTVEYSETSVEDGCMRTVIRNLYRDYHFLHGKWKSDLDGSGKDVQRRMKVFMTLARLSRLSLSVEPDIHLAMNGIQAVDLTKISRHMGRELGERVGLLGAGLLLTYRGMLVHTSLVPDHFPTSPPSASPSSVYSTISTVPPMPLAVRDAWRWAAWDWEGERRMRRRRKREQAGRALTSPSRPGPLGLAGGGDGEGDGWWKGMVSGTVSKVNPATWGRTLYGLGSLMTGSNDTPGKGKRADEDEEDEEDEAMEREDEEEERRLREMLSTAPSHSNGQEQQKGQERPNGQQILNGQERPSGQMRSNGQEEHIDQEEIPSQEEQPSQEEAGNNRGRWLTQCKEKESGTRAPLVFLDLHENALDEDPEPDQATSRMLLFQGPRGLLAQIFLEGEDADGEEMYGSLRPILQESILELEDQLRRDRSDLRRLSGEVYGPYRFIALDTRMGTVRSTLRRRRIRGETHRTLLRLRQELIMDPETRERSGRCAESGHWVLGRRDGSREVWVLVERSEASLVHAGEEFRKCIHLDLGQVVPERGSGIPLPSRKPSSG
ncbi:hypothetical protein BJ684DRAFT_15259 [Piptocephalis cylindrospora]|uniref:CCZ1/INTU/HSP4 first Longin domain-containing protein n=1 Tax=Piptocephalis cylindrospora TaxID=1907219 RepID=A0A4P9Y622_9FUNG|nr:hypothetical protein BJ684DRAFT_15259 [Piptocephalis cylindrospora]|eukprot:RKP14415.1 hypothetical protein BJ684DRAFT_15259 [Piptocephalis cylindrospora]